MVDVRYLLDLSSHPDFEGLLLAYVCAKELKGGTIQHLGEAIKHVGLTADTGYRRIRDIEDVLLGKGKQFFEKTPGKGAAKLVIENEVVEGIEDILRAYQNLRKLLAAPTTTRIRWGATLTLLVRCVPGIHRLFRSPLLGTDSELTTSADIIFSEGEWYELRDRLERGDIDIALMACPPDYPSPENKDVKLVQFVDLPRCLIYPLDHRFNPEFNEKQFDWQAAFKAKPKEAWKLLAEEPLVVLANPEVWPDFPWKDIPVQDPRRLVKVGTYVQMHAHVLAGGGLAVTHQELLGDEEEQHLTVVDVSEIMRWTRIGLFLSEKAMARRTPKEKKVVEKLIEVSCQHLEGMTKRANQRNELSERLREYRHLWHVTTGKKESVAKWVHSSVRLQATPGGLVKGIETSSVRKIAFRIFGNVLDDHLIWRGISKGAEALLQGATGVRGLIDHYAVDFPLRKMSGPLVGVWAGKDYGKRERSGIAILLTDRTKITTADELNDIVRKVRCRHLSEAGSIAEHEDPDLL